jgi:hypothetical protein
MQSPPYNMNSILDNYILENYDILLKVDDKMLLKIKKTKGKRGWPHSEP